MTARMFRFPIIRSQIPPILGASLDVDGAVVWAGPEANIKFHVDRHRRLWVYPIKAHAAVLIDAIYPEEAERLQELAEELAHNRVFMSEQVTREVHEMLIEQANTLRPREEQPDDS